MKNRLANDVLRNPLSETDARGARAKFNALPVTDRAQVAPIIEKFRLKYGDSGVQLYSKLDVAVRAVQLD